MSKMVSARVPDAVYEQASTQLAEMGSSISELVNAAFEYVLQEHTLPQKDMKSQPNRTRRLSKDARRRMQRAFKACTLELDIPTTVAYDKQIVAEVRGGKYEALA